MNNVTISAKGKEAKLTEGFAQERIFEACRKARKLQAGSRVNLDKDYFVSFGAEVNGERRVTLYRFGFVLATAIVDKYDF